VKLLDKSDHNSQISQSNLAKLERWRLGIKIPAIDKEAKDKIQRLTDGCLKYAKGDEYEYYKGRIDSIPIYVRMAKDMYKWNLDQKQNHM